MQLKILLRQFLQHRQQNVIVDLKNIIVDLKTFSKFTGKLLSWSYSCNLQDE